MPQEVVGLCGGGGPHLSSQQGRLRDYPAGPFVARLAPTMFQKVSDDRPAALWLGLLTKSPNPDGRDYGEFQAPGYARRRVTFGSYNTAFDANLEPVVFEFSEGVLATHAGLFDEEGRLRFYGFLSGHSKRSEPPTVLEFPAFGVMIRRCAPTGILPRAPAQ